MDISTAYFVSRWIYPPAYFTYLWIYPQHISLGLKLCILKSNCVSPQLSLKLTLFSTGYLAKIMPLYTYMDTSRHVSSRYTSNNHRDIKSLSSLHTMSCTNTFYYSHYTADSLIYRDGSLENREMLYIL